MIFGRGAADWPTRCRAGRRHEKPDSDLSDPEELHEATEKGRKEGQEGSDCDEDILRRILRRLDRERVPEKPVKTCGRGVSG